jgi:histidinol phosphatase-like PHP family hydrolase
MMNFPKINLHIHSNYSDGKNLIQEIVKKSVKLGLDYICITDHFTNSWKADLIPNLNTKEKLENYLTEISEIQQNLADHYEKLVLLKGVEVDITSSYDYITKLLSPLDFDIILFEYLENVDSIGFINNLLLNWKQQYGRSNSCVYGLAHFDPAYFEYTSLDVLMSFLSLNNIYYEFNSNYPQFYSHRYKNFFHELKENQIMVSIGCDSHDLSTLNDFKDPLQMIKFYNLELNFMKFFEILEKRKNKS